VLQVTADTNVLVSGLIYRRGKPFELLRMALEGEIGLATSQPIIDEALEVLGRKFGVPDEALPAYEAVIRQAARTVRPAVQLEVVKADPDDDKIVECAVSAGSAFIVTGDKHLLRMGSYDAIQIVTVADFLARSRTR
jgi:putative PIN family toxin of toxin-antitoxin system